MRAYFQLSLISLQGSGFLPPIIALIRTMRRQALWRSIPTKLGAWSVVGRPFEEAVSRPSAGLMRLLRRYPGCRPPRRRCPPGAALWTGGATTGARLSGRLLSTLSEHRSTAYSAAFTEGGFQVKYRKIISAVGAATILSGIGFAGPALAEEPVSDSEQLISAIESVAPESLEAAAASASSTADDAATYSSELTTVEVPRSLDEAASLSGLDRELAISLPFADAASEAVVVDAGVTTFDNNNGSSSVPIVHDDGSLQILTVIDGVEAPTRYDYEISVPEGGSMALIEGGAVLITDATGSFVGGVKPAWAKDADGAPVSTQYEIAGNTLTQVVDHSAATAYPVVADPWLGIQLFGQFSRGSWHGDYTYNALVTPVGSVILGGGGGVGGYLAGQAVFRGNGWDEWKAVWPAVTNKATLGQQYDCHVTASSVGLIFTGTYNLERATRNYSNWGSDVQIHHCNW